jgi:hypothetical protein
MRQLPTSFVLSRKPKEYLKQGISHCGTYSVKAILSAFGLDNRKHPKEYHTNWVGKHLFSMAVGPKYYDKIFQSYGVQSETKTAKNLPNEEKLNLLNELLSQDKPVMIRIGNGYLTEKYNPILGRIVPHWITLWGYDDKRQLFYVYDSGLPKGAWSMNIPVGNTTRTYKEILRDWNFGQWQPWCWNTSRENYLYVKIMNV